jgi:hypothetical protein
MKVQANVVAQKVVGLQAAACASCGDIAARATTPFAMTARANSCTFRKPVMNSSF